MINNLLLSRHFLSLQWEAAGLQSQFVLYLKKVFRHTFIHIRTKPQVTR